VFTLILIELKLYLKSRQLVSLHEAAVHFKKDPAAIGGMLENWVRKGRVEKIAAGTCPRGCCTCAQEKVELYRWIEAQ
jgi:putative ferrous iron transport protein C